MYIYKKMCYIMKGESSELSLLTAIINAKINGKNLSPKISTSFNYKHWVSIKDWKRCMTCANNHGKIWSISEAPYPEPPVHSYCRCSIEPMKSIVSGTATINGINGADWTLKYKSSLPDYYLSKKESSLMGWKRGACPSDFLPDKMITMGIFYNSANHLPHSDGRIWFEADINYISGKRNSQRIVWSNDGLIFVTYDHYKTFYEIV